MKRILSIDGGGIKGMFPASFLATIEDSIGDRVANYFDLIVGTSTGGIIALGLGLGFSAQEVATFYEDLGAKVFSGNVILRGIRQLIFAKYEHAQIKNALQAQFGSRKLGESTNRLVIPALNLETGEVHIFKTAHHPRFERDYKERAVDVALATASAPTYFPAHLLPSGTPLVDGGLYANNPVGLAAVEAIAVLEWPRESLQILSIGCTTTPISINLARRSGLGYFYWGPRVAEVFMTAQSSVSYGMAKLLVGPANLIRINPTMENGRFSLDSTKQTRSLKGLGSTEARKLYPDLKERFFSTPADQFIPYKNFKVNFK